MSVFRANIQIFFAIFFIFTQTATIATAWMLAQLGLNETYHVRHISMYYGRVFLSIELKSSSAFPTLIESRWPNGYSAIHSSVFPSVSAHDTTTIGNSQQNRNCRHIQQSIWSQVDGLNRLWVMDIGWRRNSDSNSSHPTTTICNPKLLVYDLLRNNAEVLRIDCSAHIKPNIDSDIIIKLGPPSKSRQCNSGGADIEKFVYFLRTDDSHILAYDIIEQRWQRRLLISPKYEQMLPEMLPIKPNDMAFGQRNNELIISDIDGGLYSTKNTLLRHEKRKEIELSVKNLENTIQKCDETSIKFDAGNTRPSDLIGTLTLEHLGSLLGPSRGMMIDYKNVLYYVVPKYGAVVRCPQYRKNLTAEGNEIIYMTSKNIQQIFFGSEDSVWLVSDRELQPNDHCFAGIS